MCSKAIVTLTIEEHTRHTKRNKLFCERAEREHNTIIIINFIYLRMLQIHGRCTSIHFYPFVWVKIWKCTCSTRYPRTICIAYIHIPYSYSAIRNYIGVAPVYHIVHVTSLWNCSNGISFKWCYWDGTHSEKITKKKKNR